MSEEQEIKDRKRALWMRTREIDSARHDQLKVAMKEYDETIHYPAKLQVKKECAALGHGAIRYHDNGIGYTFAFCNICGTDTKKEEPAK